MSKLLVISELFTAAQFLPIYNEIQVKMDGKELKRFRSNMQARERTVKAIEAYQEANDVEVDFERSVWEEKGIQFFTAEEEKVEDTLGHFGKLSVEEIGLPTRVANALIKAGYETVEDLVNADIDDLVKVRNLGEKSIKIISAALAEKDVQLPEK